MKTIPLLLIASAAITNAGPTYQLHEWGTFTTVSGSDGVLLSGLQREEEALPAFVHSHYGFENDPVKQMATMKQMMERHGMAFITPGSKGLSNRPVAGVTVKMETPVLYFHSPEAFQAKVKVGFAGGTISQWYPERSGGETLPEPTPPADPKLNPTPPSAWLIDFTKGHQGSIEWDVKVLSPEESQKQILFKPQDSLGWLRARVPGTNTVRTTSGETEGYLFYRGIGRFDPGLKTTVDSGETLHITNQTGEKIPYLVAFERTPEGKLRWTERKDGLAVGGTIDLGETDLKPEADGFAEPLYRAMKSGLAGCGLTEDESRAMVETWWKSYFEAPGLRVFWVLPKATTDRILPLEVSPAPSSLVRVIVGRSEVFRPRDEVQWQKMAAVDPPQSIWPGTVASHRFGLPMQERVTALQARAAR